MTTLGIQKCIDCKDNKRCKNENFIISQTHRKRKSICDDQYLGSLVVEAEEETYVSFTQLKLGHIGSDIHKAEAMAKST